MAATQLADAWTYYGTVIWLSSKQLQSKQIWSSFKHRYHLSIGILYCFEEVHLIFSFKLDFKNLRSCWFLASVGCTPWPPMYPGPMTRCLTRCDSQLDCSSFSTRPEVPSESVDFKKLMQEDSCLEDQIDEVLNKLMVTNKVFL